MRPDPTLWNLQADREPQEGFFGEPISAATAGIALTCGFILIPGRLALSLVMELIR
ncbi:hypothetical protein [Blastomonas sp. AAP25]|uniref:hypothetical protein n=1 Tax=Blastomonas sp. AAP25 TaxID=1523416 RepID=UPI000B2FC2FB|nr:hypothetical protein [Blastomonas sp. AAP25]